MCSFRFEQLKAWLDQYALRKHLLEIGCGKGEYLELLVQAGAQASGIEYAQASVAHSPVRSERTAGISCPPCSTPANLTL